MSDLTLPSLPPTHIVLSEVNTILLSIRTSTRLTTRARFHYEIVRSSQNQLVVELKHLRDTLLKHSLPSSSSTSSSSSLGSDGNYQTTRRGSPLQPLTLLRPFLSIVESEETPAQLTGLALSALSRFLRSCRGGLPLVGIFRSVSRTQFETRSGSATEGVLLLLLDVLDALCLRAVDILMEHHTNAPTSASSSSASSRSLPTEDFFVRILRSCFRIGREDGLGVGGPGRHSPSPSGGSGGGSGGILGGGIGSGDVLRRAGERTLRGLIERLFWSVMRTRTRTRDVSRQRQPDEEEDGGDVAVEKSRVMRGIAGEREGTPQSEEEEEGEVDEKREGEDQQRLNQDGSEEEEESEEASEEVVFVDVVGQQDRTAKDEEEGEGELEKSPTPPIPVAAEIDPPTIVPISLSHHLESSSLSSATTAGGGGGEGSVSQPLHPKPPLQASNSFPEMSSVFEFVVSLCDPSVAGKNGSIRLLGLILSSLILDIVGPDIHLCPKLLRYVENEYSRALLRNATSTNPVILSQTLRAIESVIRVLPPTSSHRQIEAFLITGHLRVILLSDDSMHELQELCLESLVTLCSFEGFVSRLYREYDRHETSYDVLESIVKVLAKTVKQSENLNALHVLALRGLVQIVHSLFLECGSVEFSSDEMIRNRAYLSYRERKTRKYKMMELCNILNKRPEEGYRALCASEEFVKVLTADEIEIRRAELEVEYAQKLLEREKRRHARQAEVARRRAQREHEEDVVEEQTTEEEEEEEVPKPEDPVVISQREDAATFLHVYSKWLAKRSLGELLHASKHGALLRVYMSRFDFRGYPIDEALRLMVFHLYLHGEGQQVTSVLDEFATHYFKTNCDHPEFGYFDTQEQAFQFAVWMTMLHSETHNPAHRGQKMDLEKFRQSCFSVIFKETVKKPSPEELERVYRNLVELEMFSSNNRCDHFKSTDMLWERSAVRESHLFVPVPPQSFSDCDLFETIWGSIAVAMRIVLENTKDDHVIDFTINGFLESAKIAAAYDLSKTLDHIVVTLGKMATLVDSSGANEDMSPGSSASESFIAGFGGNKKARMATQTMFRVTRHYGDSLREGWRVILDVIIRLFELGLLHVPFLREKDVFYRHREKKKKESSTTVTTSGSWFGLFGGSTEDSSSDKESIERAEDCVENCRIIALLSDVRNVSVASLEFLIRAVCRNARKGKKLYTVLFCLQLLVEFAVANLERIRPFWESLHDQFRYFIDVVVRQFQKNRSRLTEKEVALIRHCCDCIVTLRVQLWKNDDVRESLVATFRLLKEVPAPLFQRYVVSHVCSRVKDGLYLSNYDDAFLAWLFGVCQVASGLRESVSLARDACGRLCQLEGCPFEIDTVLATLRKLHTENDLAERLHALYVRLRGSLDERWVRIVEELGHCCLDVKNRVLRNAALGILQRIFLDSSASKKVSLDHLRLSFDRVLLPTIGSLLADQTDLRHTRLRFHSLICKTFLHFLGVMHESDLELLLDLWMKLLEIVKRCMNSNCEVLIESTPQLLKNMLLVMKEQGALTDAVWADTVGILEGPSLHSALCEIAPLVRLPKPEVVKPTSPEEPGEQDKPTG